MKIKRRTLHLFVLWSIRILIIFVLLGGYFVYTKTDFFTITLYEIEGVNVDARVSIDTQLRELAKRKIYGILPGDKIFTYSSNNIVKVMRDNVSDMAAIHIRPVGLHTIKIEVKLLTPVLKISETKAITKDGIIFSSQQDIREYPHITVASSTEETVKIEGLSFKQLFSNGEKIDAIFLENIISITTQVSSLIFPVTNILIEEDVVTLSNASNTSQVIFLKDMDTKKVWSTLVSAIDTNPLKAQLDSNKKGLLYLDVRYGNKVFYKFNDVSFQNTKGAVIISDHASTTQTPSTTSH